MIWLLPHALPLSKKYFTVMKEKRDSKKKAVVEKQICVSGYLKVVFKYKNYFKMYRRVLFLEI
jgi:hypothetical protein